MLMRPAMVAVVIGVMAIDAPTSYRSLLIEPIWREVARTGVGRPLIGVVILMHDRNCRVILQLRIGQPLIGPAAADVAAGINGSSDAYPQADSNTPHALAGNVPAATTAIAATNPEII